MLFGAVHGESIETDHLNTLEMDRRRADLPDPLFDTEGRFFTRIAQNGNDHVTEKGRSPFDQVHMTIGEGVKAAGIERPHWHS